MAFNDLISLPELPGWRKREAYFDGRARLDAIGVSLPPAMRVLELVLRWPRTAVESLAERLNVDGFSVAETDVVDRDLWVRWKATGQDALSKLVHVEAFKDGIAWVAVAPPADRTREGSLPRVVAVPGRSVRALWDPFTGDLTEAIRFWDDIPAGMKFVTHFVPGGAITYQRAHGAWVIDREEPLPTAAIPLVPFVNRARIGQPYGVSEMDDILGYTDAASRAVTQLQAGLELLALPTRYLLGVTPADLADESGARVSKVSAYFDRLITAPVGSTIGQLHGADLSQIIAAVSLYARLAASATGMPLSYFGISSDNPSSAEALRAEENRHAKKAEDKQAFFGRAWASVQRLVDEYLTGTRRPELDHLETRWRDTATPSIAAQSQAAVALVQAGVIPAVVGREMIPLTPEQRALAAQYDANDPLKTYAPAAPVPVSTVA